MDATAFRDSVVAQAVADTRGPDISVHAYLEAFADSRRVQAWFRPAEDAYVVIGHLGADGVVRIVFPKAGDDGFVKGGHTYYLPRIFSGFTSDYRTRFAMSSYAMPFSRARWQSYDGGVGYMFAIASWRPMDLGAMQDAGGWATWELSDDEYFRDPRPAIDELAALFAGSNREAYTLKYASYMGTASYASLLSANLGYNAFWPYGSAFAAGWCAGYEPLGYAFGDSYFPWVRSALLYSGLTAAYSYAYDPSQNCYRADYFPTLRIAQAPAVPPNAPPLARPIWRTPDPAVRRPENPNAPLSSRVAAPTKAAGDLNAQYRDRGLFIASDADARDSERRGGRRALDASSFMPTARPSIQDMVNIHREPAEPGYRDEPMPWSHANPRADSPGHVHEPRTAMPAESSPAAPAPTPTPRSGSASAGSSGGSPPSSPRGQKPPRN